jgi:hypothetical protein
MTIGPLFAQGAQATEGSRLRANFRHLRQWTRAFCSMKITEDVRKFAAEQKISEEQALQVSLEEKAKEFVKRGAEVYAKT